MSKLSTCKSCGKKLESNEKFIHSSKTYCEDCYKKVKRDSDEYKQLVEFICTNYNINQPTGFILKQIKEFKENFQYSYGGMTYTLWYCKEILCKELDSQYGIALVKYYYEESKSYYIQQEEITKKMKELENVELKTKVVKRNKQNNTYKNTSLLNLDNIIEGGGTH